MRRHSVAHARRQDGTIGGAPDPEVPGFMELWGYVATELEVSDALDRLRRIDAEWFLERRAETGEILNFDVQFV